jgi:hypothetical protein
MQLIVGLLLLFQTTAAQSACGSLITYRQFSVLLSSAPSCFQNGCGSPPPAETMSSTCSASQGCSHLWEFLRTQWQANSCTADCQGDVACRISGWPVLNMTSTCTTVPQEWLFSNAGDCCTASEAEPFALADWIGGLCNGSEWRRPFGYYGGMARQDWEEWIAPWNWTVRRDTTNTSLSSNSTEEECPRTNYMLWAFAIENLATSGGLVIGIAVFWAAAVMNRSRHLVRFFVPRVHSWKMALLLGIWYPLAHWLVSSFWTAALVSAEPGYGDVPVGLLALLLCARPNSLMVITCILLWLNKRTPHQFEQQLLNFVAGPEAAERYNRQYSKQLISILGLWVSVAEIIMQGLGAYSVFKTTHIGVKRGFYITGRLIPYWRGNDAMIMYAGALVHTSISFLTAFCLYLSAYCHVQEARFHEKVFKVLKWFRITAGLNRHFAHDQQREQQRRQQQPEMAETQARGSTGQLVLSSGANAELVAAGEMSSTTVTVVETPSAYHVGIDTVVLRFYVWLVGAVPQNARAQYPALQRAIDADPALRPENRTPRWATPILFLTTIFAVINFIAQWLFWAGFVKMQGPRFCPPGDPRLVRTVVLILSLLPLAGRCIFPCRDRL